MRTRIIRFRMLAVAGALGVALALPGQPARAASGPAEGGKDQEPAIVYKAPPGAQGPVRVDAVARGTTGTGPALYLLAPDHIGLTTKEQPALFWFVSQPVQTKIELSIVQDKKIIPILDLRVGAAAKAGVQKFSLPEHGIKLADGIEYRWTVALVVDEKSRSRDVVASAIIRRVEPLSSLRSRLENARPSEVPFIYASEGIWYDALESLTNLIGTESDKHRFHRQRAALLEQVQLPEPAAFDAQLARSN